MKNRPLDSTLPLSIVPVLFASLFSVAGCDDERLRELGYTLTSADATQDDGSGDVAEPCTPDPIDADGVQLAIAADLGGTPLQSRPFLRYFSLADLILRGSCSDGLEQARDAVSKLMNGLSREPAIVVPHAFGPEGGLLRIDLRDYGWTHPVDVNGRVSADGWEVLVANTGLALELAGDQASFIAEQTHTPSPVLSVTALVQVALDPSRYYALLGVPATLGELRQSVGLGSELDPLGDGALRSVQQYSRVVRASGSVRLIDRYATDVGSAGVYHEATMAPAGEFFADPLHLQPAAQRLIMFSLPNGLNGSAITDAAGVRQGNSETVLDTNLEDFRARVPLSCGNCHARGLIPATDVARSTILAHPDDFDAEVLAAYQASPSEEARVAQFATDSEPYQTAVERSTGEVDGGDPISSIWFGSDQEVDLARAASELLVSPDVLGARLPELAPEFIPLGLGLGLSRADFSAAYAAAYCVLHATDENAPAAAFCAQAP